jgi:hypothetical protein
MGHHWVVERRRSGGQVGSETSGVSDLPWGPNMVCVLPEPVCP